MKTRISVTVLFIITFVLVIFLISAMAADFSLSGEWFAETSSPALGRGQDQSYICLGPNGKFKNVIHSARGGWIEVMGIYAVSENGKIIMEGTFKNGPAGVAGQTWNASLTQNSEGYLSGNAWTSFNTRQEFAKIEKKSASCRLDQ